VRAVLAFAGAWSDLQGAAEFAALARMRHARSPTPPMDNHLAWLEDQDPCAAAGEGSHTLAQVANRRLVVGHGFPGSPSHAQGSCVVLLACYTGGMERSQRLNMLVGGWVRTWECLHETDARHARGLEAREAPKR